MFGKVWFGTLAAGVVFAAVKFAGLGIPMGWGLFLIGMPAVFLACLGVLAMMAGKTIKQEKLLRAHQLAVAREYFDGKAGAR